MSIKVEQAKQSTEEHLYDRYLGSLLASAIADAMGWITEFRQSRTELSRKGLTTISDFVTWSKPTGGRFHTYIDYVSEGEYSDDTQLTLCTARSIEPSGEFAPEYFVNELRHWIDYARGAGAAITAAARNLRDKPTMTWYSNFYRGGRGRGYVDAGGNGAAMRVAPIALANRLDALRTAESTWKNAVVTHGHPRALVGAVVFAECVRLLAETTNLTSSEFVTHLADYLSRITLPETKQFDEWRVRWEKEAGETFSDALAHTKGEMTGLLRTASDTKRPFEQTLHELGCYKYATKGSGTGCVAAAIGAYLRYPGDYPAGLLAIVNSFGIDTDTIGAMYGGLIGVRLGSLKIPDRWALRMQDYDYFLAVADALTAISLRKARANELRVDVESVRQREDRSISELARDRTVTNGQRVVHPLLGTGWVRAVSEQTIRSGGQMLLADVVLDSNQSFRFRSFRSKNSKNQAARSDVASKRRAPAHGEQAGLL